MKVLIIYENIPESTDLYVLDASKEDLEWLSLVHGCYTNYDMPKKNQKACEKLYKWLQGKAKTPIERGKPLCDLVGIERVIHTGFGM